MAYIEVHQALDDHPKTKKAARLAGVERVTMLGYLVRFWLWSLDYAPDGDLGEYTDTDIEDGINWDGEPGRFFSALCQAKFIDDGTTIHDWDIYGGKLLAKRQKDAERKREERNRTSGGHPADIRRTAQVEEKREEETRKEENSAPVVVDPVLVETVKAYESHIGIISSADSESLKELSASYPADWTVKAIELAKGKRSPMPYIRTILQNWQRGDGAPTANGQRPRLIPAQEPQK